MKKLKKLSIALLTLCLLLPVGVQAKSKSIYVVSSIKVKGSEGNYTEKIKYKNGFIKAIRSSYKDMDFSYGRNHKIKKIIENVKIQDFDGKSVYTYSWKNGKLAKEVIKSGEDTTVYKYKWKKKTPVSLVINSKGKDYDSEVVYKFTYKKGHIVKEKTDYNLTKKYYYDRKGNLNRFTIKIDKDKVADCKCQNIYENGRLVKTSDEYYLYEFDSKEKGEKIYTYKKVKVKASDVKAIKEQQWQLVNPYATTFTW